MFVLLVIMLISPPLCPSELLVPLFSVIEPPSGDVLSPMLNDIDPCVPCAAVCPVRTCMEPDEPPSADPLSNMTVPLDPPLDVPDCILIDPLSTLSLPVDTSTFPLVPVSEDPDDNTNCPPVAPNESPAPIVIDDPSPATFSPPLI